MLRGFSWVLVGVLWGSQVLAGNLQGFLWDDHGAFKTPERPTQKASLIHPMMDVCLFVCLLVYLFVCLFACLFVCLFVGLFVCLCVCLSPG